MSLEIKVGPPQLAIHHGSTVLVCDPNGDITPPSDKGLYFYDTRLISHWRVYANGESWDLLNSGSITHFAHRVYLANREVLTEDGIIPRHTIGMIRSRSIGGGLHEDLDVTNHGLKPVRFNLDSPSGATLPTFSKLNRSGSCDAGEFRPIGSPSSHSS